MITQELRSFTKEHHASLEKRLITRIKNIRTREAYVELLILFYGFYHPLENRLGELLTESNFPGYTQRRKSETAKETFITFNHWIDQYEQYASKQ